VFFREIFEDCYNHISLQHTFPHWEASNSVKSTECKCKLLHKQEAFEKCWAHSLLRAVLHCQSPGVATAATVACRLRIDVHDDDNDDDNAWQRGPLWPHGMGPITTITYVYCCCRPIWVPVRQSWTMVSATSFPNKAVMGTENGCSQWCVFFIALLLSVG